MKEEKIKQAFLRAKQDISFLKNEIDQLRLEINELKQLIQHQNYENKPNFNQKHTSTDNFNNQTLSATSTDTSTVPQEIEGLRSPNLSISTGNEGVESGVLELETHEFWGFRA